MISKNNIPLSLHLKKEDMIADGLSAPLHEGAKRYIKSWINVIQIHN